MSKFYPGLNRLLIKQCDLPDSGSILSSAISAYAYGTIEAVGSIKDKAELNPEQFQVGDNVYFLSQSGTNIDLPEGTLRLLPITEVLVGVKKEGSND